MIVQLSTPPPSGTICDSRRDDDAGRGGLELHPLAADLGAERHVVDEGAAAGHAVDLAALDLEAGLAVAGRRGWWRRSQSVTSMMIFGLLAGAEIAVIGQRRIVRGNIDGRSHRELMVTKPWLSTIVGAGNAAWSIFAVMRTST